MDMAQACSGEGDGARPSVEMDAALLPLAPINRIRKKSPFAKKGLKSVGQ